MFDAFCENRGTTSAGGAETGRRRRVLQNAYLKTENRAFSIEIRSESGNSGNPTRKVDSRDMHKQRDLEIWCRTMSTIRSEEQYVSENDLFGDFGGPRPEITRQLEGKSSTFGALLLPVSGGQR